MNRAQLAIVSVAICFAGWVHAQAPAAPATGGIQGQNIFEVKPDANLDPKYAGQTNAERAKVQPGNNAPMWRQVGSGVTGFTSLPKSEAP